MRGVTEGTGDVYDMGCTPLRLDLSSGSQCSGWYASYWNAFLLTDIPTENQKVIDRIYNSKAPKILVDIKTGRSHSMNKLSLPARKTSIERKRSYSFECKSKKQTQV